jgi:hypothetical protein
MLMRNGLTIVNVCSTIFRKPIEESLHFEAPRRGYCREAGFVAIEAGREPPTTI